MLLGGSKYVVMMLQPRNYARLQSHHLIIDLLVEHSSLLIPTHTHTHTHTHIYIYIYIYIWVYWRENPIPIKNKRKKKRRGKRWEKDFVEWEAPQKHWYWLQNFLSLGAPDELVVWLGWVGRGFVPEPAVCWDGRGVEFLPSVQTHPPQLLTQTSPQRLQSPLHSFSSSQPVHYASYYSLPLSPP